MARLESRFGLYCRALWLVKADLIDVRIGGVDEAGALLLGLERLRFRDDAAATMAAQGFLRSERSLLVVIEELVDSMFVQERGLLSIRQGLAAADLRRLIRLIDPDVLVCLSAKLQVDVNDRFDWSAVPLDNGGAVSALLRQGSVETHIHLGGALPPVFYWVLLMSCELSLERAGEIRSGLRGHASKEVWCEALYQAMWTRYQLVWELEDLAQEAGESPVFPHLAITTPKWRGVFSADAAPNSFEIRERVADLALSEERSGRQPFSDPLLPPGEAGQDCHYASGERRLLYHLGRFLRQYRSQRGPKRRSLKELEQALLAYLRIRNAFHELMVHDYGTDGLFRFEEAFKRRGLGQEGTRRGRSARRRRLRRRMQKFERIRMKAALDCQLLHPFDLSERMGTALPARGIEMRVSVPEGAYALRMLRAWVQGVADHLRSVERDGQSEVSQVGFLFHALKKEGKTKVNAARDTERLRLLLEEFPRLRPFVVGFDGAGKERSAPPRDFLQAFQILKRLVREHRPGPGLPPVRLGFTYHVGEDMADLLTGLRHLDEAVSLLLPRFEGGRLGHALALGDDPARFYGNRGLQTEPLLRNHLLDLVWAWGRLSEIDGTFCQSLRTRIGKWSGHSVPETAIALCYERMGLDADEPGLLSEEELATLLEAKADLSTPVVVQADEAWQNLMWSLQDLLQKRIALRPVTIEANPTSNLIIGGFVDYSQLPYERLVNAGLPVSINTDDPGLFMTSLPGELAALYTTWEGKRPHREILTWLADRLTDSQRSTFLGPQHHASARGWSEEEIDEIFRSVREG